jgi:tRNA(adenine34) deaminase
MEQAINLAHEAYTKNEVPVGAVLVKDNKIIGAGHNCPISTNDPTAHAEIIAIRNAAKNIGNYRLVNTTLYVTIEPCAMCFTAMIHSRIENLIFGANDIRWGAVNSMINLQEIAKWNHKINTKSGLLQDQCSHIMKSFFKEKR